MDIYTLPFPPDHGHTAYHSRGHGLQCQGIAKIRIARAVLPGIINRHEEAEDGVDHIRNRLDLGGIDTAVVGVVIMAADSVNVAARPGTPDNGPDHASQNQPRARGKILPDDFQTRDLFEVVKPPEPFYHAAAGRRCDEQGDANQTYEVA